MEYSVSFDDHRKIYCDLYHREFVLLPFLRNRKTRLAFK